MGNEGGTFLEQKKAEVAEQKRFLRQGNSSGLAELMLAIGDTNFLITEEQSRIAYLSEVGTDLRLSSYPGKITDGVVVIEPGGGWGWLSRDCNLMKIHQLGCGEPDNYRAQALQAGGLQNGQPPPDKGIMSKLTGGG